MYISILKKLNLYLDVIFFVFIPKIAWGILLCSQITTSMIGIEGFESEERLEMMSQRHFFAVSYTLHCSFYTPRVAILSF